MSFGENKDQMSEDSRTAVQNFMTNMGEFMQDMEAYTKERSGRPPSCSGRNTWIWSNYFNYSSELNVMAIGNCTF